MSSLSFWIFGGFRISELRDPYDTYRLFSRILGIRNLDGLPDLLHVSSTDGWSRSFRDFASSKAERLPSLLPNVQIPNMKGSHDTDPS